MTVATAPAKGYASSMYKPSSAIATLLAIVSVSCGGGGDASGGNGDGEYVPALPGTWRGLTDSGGLVTIQPVVDDPNFFSTGPVTVDIPGEADFASADLGSRKIQVPLSNGKTTLLQFVGNVQLQRDGATIYWKSLTPKIAGIWCSADGSARILQIDEQIDEPDPADPPVSYVFSGAETGAGAAAPLSGRVDFRSHGTDNDGQEVLEARISELKLRTGAVAQTWLGEFDGSSTIRLVSGTAKLSLQRKRTVADCH